MAAEATTDKKTLIDQACETAKQFIEIHYDKMDTKRHTVAKTYLDTATLSWNGNRIDGKHPPHFPPNAIFLLLKPLCLLAFRGIFTLTLSYVVYTYL